MTDSSVLVTSAEQFAERAEELPAFSGLKLLHIKREVTRILSLIGRGGIFDEYTLHDVSHINAMLEMLEWLIPEETVSAMSPADWLMLVLAIYFHDTGMLVTREEFPTCARNRPFLFSVTRCLLIVSALITVEKWRPWGLATRSDFSTRSSSGAVTQRGRRRVVDRRLSQ